MPLSASDRAIHVVAAAIHDANGAVLVAQRPPHKHQGGLWEFPGGKVEAGESALCALRREIEEEIGIEVLEARPLIRLDHDYLDRRVVLDVWRVLRWSGSPRGREGQPLLWRLPDSLPTLAMPAADAPVVAALRLPDTYLVTPEVGDENQFLAQLESRIRSGICLVQLRATSCSEARYAALAARVLASRENGSGARILLNAAPEIARQLDADGVHLNSVRLHRCLERPLPRNKWVAASCHNLSDLLQAQRIGVDFAVLGPVLRTASHPDAVPIGWDRFGIEVGSISIPVYAIGGLHPADLPTAWTHGAQGIAAIQGLWGKG
jgi:8-oxo-dGTP diphosphatase